MRRGLRPPETSWRRRWRRRKSGTGRTSIDSVPLVRPGGCRRRALSYNHSMSKQAISVTLDEENLTWLKGRAGASRVRSVSELLDRIVAAARGAGGIGPSRSVVGTVDIDEGDPSLEQADAAIRALFDAPVRR